MSLRMYNAQANITRQMANHGTITVMPTPPLTGTVNAMVQPAKEGQHMAVPPWAVLGTTEGLYAEYKIFIGGADENGDTYEPKPGDQIVISGGSRLINGVYRQVAYVAHHEGQGLDYWNLPCVKVQEALL